MRNTRYWNYVGSQPMSCFNAINSMRNTRILIFRSFLIIYVSTLLIACAIRACRVQTYHTGESFNAINSMRNTRALKLGGMGLLDRFNAINSMRNTRLFGGQQ